MGADQAAGAWSFKLGGGFGVNSAGLIYSVSYRDFDKGQTNFWNIV